MKKLFCGLLSLFSLASCTDLQPLLPTQAASVQVELSVESELIDLQTRATDENAIRDVNFYLVSPAYKEIVHGYQTTSNLRFECPPGEYDLYVIANMHEDMGSKTVAALHSLKLNYATQYVDLPMWSKTSVTIPTQNTLCRLPAIKVKRGLAKVVVNVQSAVSDIVPKSIRMVNIPRASSPFDQDHAPSSSISDYTKGPITSFPDPQDSYAVVYYLPENLQGERPGITSQEQKGPDNAPMYATYVLIRAEKDKQALAYRIYLGANNTTNFDLKRNTCYTLNIRIQGVNEVDTRVACYGLNIWSDFSEDACGEYCPAGTSRNINIEVNGENSSRMRGWLMLESGSVPDFSFNEQSGFTEYDFRIRNIHGNNSFPMRYNPTIVSRSNSLLQYNVIIEDEDGIQLSYHLQNKFGNAVHVFRSTNSGRVTASGALASQMLSDGTFMAMCFEDGCTLHAIPDSEAIFEGWYADNIFRKVLSTQTNYNYIPSSSIGSIYAKFSPRIALDTDGTANCYIAPRRHTHYSFNATLRGNNKATTNLGTGTLSGTKAKVIWETGNRAGDVISDVSYLAGRILFRTGAAEGNALIGLFNDEDKCIWSWHIWATNYDPALTQQTYRGGSIFMDRNIGALSGDHKHFSTRGLYYQWGRKDPFLYAEDMTSLVPAPAVYQNGYGNDTYSKATTVAYTTEHPTTFIKTDSDWQLKVIAFINLWGNTSSSISALTDTGAKSVFDPCPPGWRIPDRRVWEKADLKIKTMDYYYSFMCDTGNPEDTLYPLSGIFNGTGWSNTGVWSYTWTNAPTADGATALLLRPDAVHPTENVKRSYGIPVRCMKE